MKTTTVTTDYANNLRNSYITETILALIACLTMHIMIRYATGHWLHQICNSLPVIHRDHAALALVGESFQIVTLTHFYAACVAFFGLLITTGWFFFSLHKMSYWCAAAKDCKTIPVTIETSTLRNMFELITAITCLAAGYMFIRVVLGVYLHEVIYAWPDTESFPGVVLLGMRNGVHWITDKEVFRLAMAILMSLLFVLVWGGITVKQILSPKKPQ